jgi:hypothetical protein
VIRLFSLSKLRAKNCNSKEKKWWYRNNVKLILLAMFRCPPFQLTIL